MREPLFTVLGYNSYQEFVKDTFIEHQIAFGQDVEEATDIFNETKFESIEKFLIKSGYDLGENNYE